MNCEYCENYLKELDRCKFCHFEVCDEYKYVTNDDWDIFKLDEEYGWSFNQIENRLHWKGINCDSVDIWFDDNLAVIYGCDSNSSVIARILNINEDVIYRDNSNLILNLYQEKCLRKGVLLK